MSTSIATSILRIHDHYLLLQRIETLFPDAMEYVLGEHTFYVTSKAWPHVKYVRFFPVSRDRFLSAGTVWFQADIDGQRAPVFTPDPMSIELFMEDINRGHSLMQIIDASRARWRQLHPGD